MNPAKQSTLFQSWGKKESKSQTSHSKSGGQQVHVPAGTSSANLKNVVSDVINISDEEDGEDEMLAMALEESLRSFEQEQSNKWDKSVPNAAKNTSESVCRPSTSAAQIDKFSEDLQSEFDPALFAADFEPSQSLCEIEDIPGFDKVAGKLWIYPTNYPVRQYQFNIVNKALFKNTLVTLPTGLGKTFIAAVVMYNFYRWYPQGKIVFMAPTKPLVAQQIEACYNIMGIPQEDTAEMTGTMVPAERLKAWNYKRVFFLTPQVLTNDLSRGACPSVDMKCLVIDEAHKALGNHAYCQVVRELIKYTKDFRILALSATPGSDIKAVQQVVANLLISHIELRTEESIDIVPYVHERKVTKIVVPMGAELTAIKEKYIRVMDVIVKRLSHRKVLYNRQTTSLSKFMILKARDAFRQNPPPGLQKNQYGVIEGDFALAMSLYHGYELIQLHGLKSLYSYLEGLVSGEKGSAKTRADLNRNADFKDILEELHNKYGDSLSAENKTNPFALSQRQTPNQPFVSGHPKMEKLREVVVDHFHKFDGDSGGPSNTRIMIFSQYRDSVTEITDMLSRHRPLVKVMSFIGQSSAGKATKGFTQKEQLRVMKKFREGGYNTLVSTCVGEEGLDIGDVDLIICFDASKSPIRLVQRMGRTGRKREGSIVMLMTAGKEEQIYNQSQYSKKSIHKAILNGAKSLQYYPHSPRMVPQNLQPNCHKMHITVQKAFKSTARGRTSTESNKTQKISEYASKSGKRSVKSDGFLTDAELRYWSENFKMPDSEVPKLPDSEFRCFKKGSQPQVLCEEEENSGQFLQLSEWMPWQNRLQDTLKIDHSMKSEHLVEMMEFIDLQQTLGEDDNSYAIEMAAYLNYDDVIVENRPAVENSGIKKFCSTDFKEDGVKCDKVSRPAPYSVRRSAALPEIVFDPLDSSSDEELPPFLGKAQDKAAHFTDTEVVKTCKTAPDLTKLTSNGKGYSECASKDTNSSSFSEKSNTSSDANTNKGKTSSLKRKRSKINDAKQKTKGTGDLLKTAKRKKKVENKRNASIVEIILDGNDDDDFVTTVESKLETVAEENGDEQTSQAMEVEIRDDKMKETCCDEENARLSQLLPDFRLLSKSLNSPSFLQASCQRSDIHIDSTEKQVCRTQWARIPPPPPLEEIQKAFSQLDRNGGFSSIDLPQLADEWEHEKTLAIGNGICNKSSVAKSEISPTSPTLSCKKTRMSVATNSVQVSVESRNDSGFVVNNLDDNTFTDADKNLSIEKTINQKSDSKGKPVYADGNKFMSTSTNLNRSSSVTDIDTVMEDVNTDDDILVQHCGNTGISKSVTYKNTNEKYISEDDEKHGFSYDLSPKGDSNETNSENGPNHSGLNCDKHADTEGSQGFPVLTPGLAAKDSIKSEILAEASQVFDEPAEIMEDYGEWNLELPDFDNDIDVDGQEVQELPRSPMINESSVPFHSYSEIKQTPLARVRPVNSEPHLEGDFDDLDDADLFTSNIKTPVSAVKGASLRLGKPTPDKTPAHGLDESQFTFTQALDCLHESPAPTQTTTPIFAAKSVLNTTSASSTSLKSAERSGIKASTSKSLFFDSDSDSNDRPEFNLGFSWDDVDVVPPSPVQEQSLCQKTSKGSQSMVFGKRKLSLDTTRKSDSCVVDDDVFDDLDEDLLGFTDHTANPFEQSVVFSASAVEKTVDMEEVTETVRSPPAVPCKEAVLPGSPVFTPPAFLTARVAEKKKALKEESSSDSDDSFCVVKKVVRKNRLIDSPALSCAENENLLTSPVKPFEFKTPNRPCNKTRVRRTTNTSSNKSLNFSTESDESPVLVKRKNTRPVNIVLSDDDEDFADTSVKYQKAVEDKPFIKKPNKKKRCGIPSAFIDYEAVLSDDGASGVSEDEIDDSQMDSILQNFIHDGSQISQAPDGPDETAMYLRSVMSPVLRGCDGVYRRDRPKVLDVYSQVPTEEDLADYMEDSFCVLEDEDDEEQERSDDSCLGEISCFYPAEKRSKGRDNPKKHRGKEVDRQRGGNRRRRIVTQIDSSSEEEEEVGGGGQRMDTSDLCDTSTPCQRSKRARILSSSDDDLTDYNNKKPDQVQIPDASFSPPMLSLKSRLQRNVRNKAPDRSLSLINLSSKPGGSFYGNSSNCEAEGKHLSTDKTGVGSNVTAQEEQSSTSINISLDRLTCGKLNLKTGDQQREERLKRQREKQEEFRRKMAAEKDLLIAQQRQTSDQLTKTEKSVTQSHVDHAQSSSVCQQPVPTPSESMGNDFTKLQNPRTKSLVESDLPLESCLVTSPGLRKLQEKKIAILVDSREIAGGQEVVSCLRVSHQFNVAVRQLSGCDYILSNRLAVERKQWSDFANGSNRAKLQERIQQMCVLYDRSCLVIERDRVKAGEEKSARPQVRTKYVDTSLAWLARSSVQTFFTDTQEETAALLADLCKLEERKGMAIHVNLELDHYHEQWMKFFTSIPSISYINALNLCHGFKNLSEICNSPARAIEIKGQMSESKAKDVKDFLHHHFCLAMVPVSSHT